MQNLHPRILEIPLPIATPLIILQFIFFFSCVIAVDGNSFFFSGVIAVDGLLYVVGGDDGTANLTSVEVYNPVDDSWTMLPAELSLGRSYAGLAAVEKHPS